MPTVGPQLPPHLQGKRKHNDEQDSDASSDDSTGPQLPGDSKRQKTEEVSDVASGPVIGPAPPPASLDERPEDSPGDESSEDDDDYGPPPPPVNDIGNAPVKSVFDEDRTEEPRKPEEKSKRDDWMMLPPQQDDLAARMDPTKLRAKGFSSGKGAKQGSGEVSSIWTETPEERRKRLENQVMGVKSSEDGSSSSSSNKASAASKRKEQEDAEKARKIREHNEKYRSQSLYEQHKKGSKKIEEDDPSKRAFDYEKDIAAGTKIGHAQRKEMMNKAANFGNKFSKGSYL